MKKNKIISLLVSSALIATLLPTIVYGKTDNRITNIITGSEDLAVTGTKLIIEGDDLETLGLIPNTTPADLTFQLKLSNAEWAETFGPADIMVNGVQGTNNTVVISKISSTTKMITLVEYKSAGSNSKIEVVLNTVLTNDGDATVTIDPRSSVLSADTLKFANVVEGEAEVSIDGDTDIREGSKGTEINTIIIEETTAGVIKKGDEIRLRLSKGFEFTQTPSVSLFGFPSGTTYTLTKEDSDEYTLVLSETSTSAGIISITDVWISYDEDDVESGDICELTISGAGLTKETIEIGEAAGYGVDIEADNEDLPVLIAGRGQDEQEDDPITVTFEETIPGSWLEDRTTEIVFPRGVKVDAADGDDVAGEMIESKNSAISNLEAIVEQKDDYSVIKIKGDRSTSNTDVKAELEAEFDLSIDPSFEGDVVITFEGSGLEEDVEVTIAEVIPVVKVEAKTNEVSIDYREVGIGDIIITETKEENLLSNTTLALALDGGMIFDGEPTVEVIEGDLEIDDAEVDDGWIKISIDSSSQKEPGVIKVSNVKLFLDRMLPAGSYELALVEADDGEEVGRSAESAIFRNYNKNGDDQNFDTDEISILEDYVEVVTAGRDQGAYTFTTEIEIQIGASQFMAGSKTYYTDTPAYISEGYTMMPVRAISEALTGELVVRWDDATKTVTISLGSRIINMQVGSKVMNVNGVPVQMSKACEITNSRAFIPLRDLGYALGLKEDQIKWDDGTKTATLN